MDDAVPRLILMALALACLSPGCGADDAAETVAIYGYVMVGHEQSDPPVVLTGGQLDAFDDEGRLLAEGSEPWSDTPGYYRVRGLPPLSHVHLMAWVPESLDLGDDDDSASGSAGDDDDDSGSADDDDSAGGGQSDDDDSASGSAGDEAETFVPTLVSAWTPEANLYAYDGEIFILTLSWLEDFLESVTGLGLGLPADQVVVPGMDGTGGFVLGALDDPDTYLGTRITVSGADAAPRTLYLDEQGQASPDLEATGPGGWFVVLGIPQGPVEVTVTTPDGIELEPFVALIAEDACTSLIGLELNP